MGGILQMGLLLCSCGGGSLHRRSRIPAWGLAVLVLSGFFPVFGCGEVLVVRLLAYFGMRGLLVWRACHLSWLYTFMGRVVSLLRMPRRLRCLCWWCCWLMLGYLVPLSSQLVKFFAGVQEVVTWCSGEDVVL